MKEYGLTVGELKKALEGRSDSDFIYIETGFDSEQCDESILSTITKDDYEVVFIRAFCAHNSLSDSHVYIAGNY